MTQSENDKTTEEIKVEEITPEISTDESQIEGGVPPHYHKQYRLDHSNLNGLANDNHIQYHNNARGDARYLYKENTDVFTPNANYEPATKKYVDDNIPVVPPIPSISNLMGAGETSLKVYYNFWFPFSSYWFPGGSAAAMWSITGASITEQQTGYGCLRMISSGEHKLITVGNLFFNHINDSQFRFNYPKKIIVEFWAMAYIATINRQVVFGLVSHANALIDYDDNTYSSVVFSILRGAGTTQLYAHTSKPGTGHTETEIADVNCLASLSQYRIEFDPGVDAKFYINGILVATITTNLPNSADDVIYFGVGGSGSDACIKNLTAPYFSIEV